MSAKVHWREERGAWFLYVYANGTQKAKRLGPTPADKRRGEQLAREILRLQVRGQLGVQKRAKPVPFGEFARRWVETKVKLPIERGLEGHLAPKTAALRDQAVRLHLCPLLGSRDVRTLDVAAIDGLWAGLLERRHPRADRHLSRRSLEIVLGTLRMILADAVAKRLLAANPVDQWKAVQPKGRGTGRLRPLDSRKVLEFDERERVLKSTRELAEEHHAFVLFLAETGCRIGEAIALRWADVDLEIGVARIFRQKTGGEPTDAELSDRLRAALAKRRPDVHPPDALVFPSRTGGHLDAENFRRRVWSGIIGDAIPGRALTPHCLRHTWASLHLARGTPIKWVQEQGGWASSKMLLDVYGHFMPREMRGFSNVLGGPPDLTRPDRKPAALASDSSAPSEVRDAAADPWRPRRDSNARPAA